MNAINYLPLITKNSFRNRRRSVLTIGSLMVSLCLLVMLMAMYKVLFYGSEQTPAQAVRIMMRHKVSLAQSIPLSYEGKIRQVPGVKAVSVRQWFGGTYRDARDPKNFFARFGVRPADLFIAYPEYVISEEEKQAFERERTGCVASRPLAEKFGWKPGERIMLVGDFFPTTLELKLVGVFEEPNKFEALFFNWDYLRDSLKAAGTLDLDFTSQYLVLADSPDDVPRVTKAIDDMFDNSPYPTKSESEQSFVLSFVGFLGNLKLFLLAIGGAVTFTILLVSANTLSMSVRERIREVGVLKTLGFTPGTIFGILLGEGAMIAILGGVLGCALAEGFCLTLRNAPIPIQQIKVMNVTPLIAAISLLIALLVGLVSAMIPAAGAARRPILDSLRHTG
ncbi:MAG: ABC transporter permease [Chloracidobacterium sp.]|nr:ABC transporter permease [Chloracidobacterium sp.]